MTHHKHHDDSQTLCPACEIGPFVRNHYFTGKLMLERDFTDEQRYFIEKLRHHHQRLHGWGVVCGLKVKQHENPACRDRYICIEPGTAIDCCGHEIVIREEECIDITQLTSIKALIDKKDDQRHTLQICLRYRECPTEEIPVLYDECGCDDTRCAPNRILESYDIDVLVDPPASEVPFHTPLLKWHCTVGPAHASRVALHATSRRLYVITADSAKTVFQLDTDNYTVVGAHALPEKGLELAVSNDGARVYVVTEGASGASDCQLVVLDTANNMGNDQISNSIIEQSAGNDIFLSVAPAPDNRLFALLGAKGDVLVWPTNLDSATPQPDPDPSSPVNLGVDLRGLVIGSGAKEAFTTDAGGNVLQRLDIVGMVKGTAISLPNLAPSELALVSSTGPDMLAVVSESNKKLYLVGLNPDTLVGSVSLDHDPIALTVSPGGQWAYVLEQDTAGSFVQAVNLHRMQLPLSPVVGTPFKVGDASQQIVVSDSGAHLYIPFTGDMVKPVVGGVAVLDVSEQACEEILWRHLDGCPQCDSPNCVVLATIEHYQIGDKIQDQTDPLADPADGIARIDNRKGRQLLPSTQVLKELIECLMEQGPGGTGTQGPPGHQGDKGDPGIDDVSLDMQPCNIPELAEIFTDTSGKRILKLVIPTNCDTDLTHICAINWVHPQSTNNPIDNPANATPISKLAKGVLIVFDRPVRKGDIHEHSFIVLERPQTEGPENRCWCEVLIRRVGGVMFPTPCEITEDFTLPSELDKFVNGAQLLPNKPFERGKQYRVVLKGDFIRDKEDKAVDANHLPPWLPDQPSGDGTEGGTFESWFFIGQG